MCIGNKESLIHARLYALVDDGGPAADECVLLLSMSADTLSVDGFQAVAGLTWCMKVRRNWAAMS